MLEFIWNNLQEFSIIILFIWLFILTKKLNKLSKLNGIRDLLVADKLKKHKKKK